MYMYVHAYVYASYIHMLGKHTFMAMRNYKFHTGLIF